MEDEGTYFQRRRVGSDIHSRDLQLSKLRLLSRYQAVPSGQCTVPVELSKFLVVSVNKHLLMMVSLAEREYNIFNLGLMFGDVGTDYVCPVNL